MNWKKVDYDLYLACTTPGETPVALETALMAAAENEAEKADIQLGAYYLGDSLADQPRSVGSRIQPQPLQPLEWEESPVLHLLDLGGPYCFLCAYQPGHPVLVLTLAQARTPEEVVQKLFGDAQDVVRILRPNVRRGRRHAV